MCWDHLAPLELVSVGSLKTFYQNSFPSHLRDFNRVRLQLVYVKFTNIFDRSFTFDYYRKFVNAER